MFLMFCPTCGHHWMVETALGGWIQDHVPCDKALVFCDFDDQHTEQTVMDAAGHAVMAGFAPHSLRA